MAGRLGNSPSVTVTVPLRVRTSLRPEAAARRVNRVPAMVSTGSLWQCCSLKIAGMVELWLGKRASPDSNNQPNEPSAFSQPATHESYRASGEILLSVPHVHLRSG